MRRPVLQDLLHRALLHRDALLLWRHPRARPAPVDVLGPSLVRVDQRRYGDAVLDTFVAADGHAAPPEGARGGP